MVRTAPLLALGFAFALGCDRGPAPTADAALAGSASDAAASAPDGAASAQAAAPRSETPSSEPEPLPSPAPSASAGPAVAKPESGATLKTSPVSHDFAGGPLYFSPAYDGSLRFSLWTGTMRLSRELFAKTGKKAHFSFFVNSVYYSTERSKSDIAHALSHDEVLVRRALTQQAINEGHEIGNHGAGHLDGRAWSREEWEAELARFHQTMDGTLFIPVRDAEGKPLFPRWRALPEAKPGEAGARCSTDTACASGPCVALSDEVSVCSQACNAKRRCPAKLACGAPAFREDTDLCLPLPELPLVIDGKTWFDARGNANRKIAELVPYRFVGFRAPYLAENAALFAALAARGYRYDTSLVKAPPDKPYFIEIGEKKLLQFALMPHPGALSIPMDYNYRLEKGSAERMEQDYQDALVRSYAEGRRPFNVGHHFASWGEGSYLGVMERTVRFVLEGCPDASGKRRCEQAEVVSFRELADRCEG